MIWETFPWAFRKLYHWFSLWLIWTFTSYLLLVLIGFMFPVTFEAYHKSSLVYSTHLWEWDHDGWFNIHWFTNQQVSFVYLHGISRYSSNLYTSTSADQLYLSYRYSPSFIYREHSSWVSSILCFWWGSFWNIAFWIILQTTVLWSSIFWSLRVSVTLD